MDPRQESKDQELSEEQKKALREHARAFLRACGVPVAPGDSEPLKVEIIDDDGNVIKTVYK